VKKILFIFLFLLLITTNLYTEEKTLNVIDGDTIKINNIKYRFSGIDTPEINQTCKKDEEIIYCGIIAKNKLIEKIGSHIPNCIAESTDRYKRIIAECFVNNKSLSKYLVRNGYAFAYRKYSKKFILDEDFAKKNKLGLWQMEFQYPWEYRKTNN
tara:strand:- start:59 stop:523 length:465 start_codon:yes stop_codon:yes gene_type:complete